MEKIIKKCGYKLIISIISIWLVATITFFLFNLMPGEIYNIDSIKNQNVINNIIEKYGLNLPIERQYMQMIINLIKLDFGNSFILNGVSVNKIIFTHFPLSAWLGVNAFIVAVINGFIIGLLINKMKKRYLSKLIKIFLILLSSLPTFEIAAILQYLLCVKLHWFPIISSSNKDAMILPIIVLSIIPMINIARLTSSRLKYIEKEDYVLAARLRGVSQRNILVFYKLKNCLSPIITYLGSVLASMIAGSFVVESMFSIPGLGRYFISSITNRDYPLVMGLTVFYAILLISINYIAELIVIIFDHGKGGLEN